MYNMKFAILCEILDSLLLQVCKENTEFLGV